MGRRRQPEDISKIPKRPSRQHEVVAVTLSSRQLNWLAEVSRELAAMRISRSEIVRAAIDHLADRMAEKTIAEVCRYIVERSQDKRLIVPISVSSESTP